MYFPVSGVETPLLLPPLAAFLVTTLTSMGGVSGAFLLLPFQVSVLGYATPSVSATNHVFNIVATPGGIYRYFKEGRLLLPLALVTTLGSLPGVVMGAFVRLQWLAEISKFKIFAGLVLLYLALRLVLDLLQNREKSPAPGTAKPTIHEMSPYGVTFSFQDQMYQFHPWRVFLLTSGIGLVGGIYGIGGGSILAPFLVSVFRLPVHVVAGPTLLCTLATSLGGVISYLLLSPFYPSLAVQPDWLLGLLFGLGGLAGTYCGAMLQKHIPARPLKLAITAIICGLAASWLLPAL